MTECPVPYIDFGLFWKISAVVLVPSLIPLANLILIALGKVEELKAKIRSSIGRDESGVPYRLPAAKREVLNYDLPKRIKLLLWCIAAQFACVLLYVVVRNGWPINLGNLVRVHACIPSVATYLGLLPVAVSLLLFMSILFYYVRLWKESAQG